MFRARLFRARLFVHPHFGPGRRESVVGGGGEGRHWRDELADRRALERRMEEIRREDEEIVLILGVWLEGL